MPSRPIKSSHSQQIRIIGGKWKRTPLTVLNALNLRPTPDRVRETIFNWLHFLFNQSWEQRHCLDLFAGSGALGFEAASLGAAHVIMIDNNPALIAQLNTTQQKLQAQQISLLKQDALSALRTFNRQKQQFDLIFLDPPYDANLLPALVPLCLPLIKEQGLLYVESGTPLETMAAWLAQWEILREGKAGVVHHYILSPKMQALA
jgi:16S rRNA (guanine966-N2)-methyltransferase